MTDLSPAASAVSSPFNLIVDSCCDLPQSFLDEHDVRLVHFTYAEASKPGGGLSGVDDLFESRSAHEFYQAMREGATPMTSQPSPGELYRAFSEAADTGLPSVYLCFSSGLSGCYEGAISARELLRSERGDDMPEIDIVDTRQASASFSLYVVEAVRQRESGIGAKGLVNWATNAIPHDHIMFMVDCLDWLAHGGRIPSGAAKIGSALGVRPMLSIDLDGKLTIAGIARGRKNAMRRFVNTFRSERAKMTDEEREAYSNTVIIGNADCPNDAQDLEKLLRAIDPAIATMHVSIGPTIGCHVGPGMLACCFWGPDRNRTGLDKG
jgi:DegV family protein with EDD domain